MDFDSSQPWYHGSPSVLITIREGSTITQNRELVRIFSHKPTIVSRSDDGQIKHNGTLRGYLYAIAEGIEPGDVTPHPRTTMGPGDEWLTSRKLRVELLCSFELVPEEQLTNQELVVLQEHLAEQRTRREVGALTSVAADVAIEAPRDSDAGSVSPG